MRKKANAEDIRFMINAVSTFMHDFNEAGKRLEKAGNVCCEVCDDDRSKEFAVAALEANDRLSTAVGGLAYSLGLNLIKEYRALFKEASNTPVIEEPRRYTMGSRRAIIDIRTDMEGVSALREYAESIPHALNEMQNAAFRLRNAFESRQDTLGPHNEEIQDILFQLQSFLNDTSEELAAVQKALVEESDTLEQIINGSFF